MPSLAKQSSTMLSSFFSVATGNEQNLSSSAFSGTWLVQDSNGNPFEITLFGSGTAEANRASEGLSGTWVETDDQATAVITWDTGWTTKITHAGDHYVKTAYDQASATPANTSEAERV